MVLKAQLTEDQKTAMRAKDTVRLRTIRAVRAALLAKEIEQREGGTATLSEADELAVLQKQAKQRREAIAQYETAGRTDLAEQEQAELAIIEAYLPTQLSDADIKKVVGEIIQNTGATSMRDMGKVMGAAMGQLKGQADGRRVQAMVKELLMA